MKNNNSFGARQQGPTLQSLIPLTLLQSGSRFTLSNEGANIMSHTVDNANQLQSIIRPAVVSLYGRTAKNITIQEAERIPLFKKPKQCWQVDVLFNDDKHKYEVQFDITIKDGLVTRVHEMHRDPIAT